MVLVIVLEAAAWAQSICCAPADLFLLMPNVQPLMYHLGHTDGEGVRELSLGETNRFEVYAVCVAFHPLIFVLQTTDHVVAIQCQLDALVEVGCRRVVPHVEGYLGSLRRSGSAAYYARVMHHPLYSGVAVNVQTRWEGESFVWDGTILVAFYVVEGELLEFLEKQPGLVG